MIHQLLQILWRHGSLKMLSICTCIGWLSAALKISVCHEGRSCDVVEAFCFRCESWISTTSACWMCIWWELQRIEDAQKLMLSIEAILINHPMHGNYYLVVLICHQSYWLPDDDNSLLATTIWRTANWVLWDSLKGKRAMQVAIFGKPTMFQ